MSLTMFDQGEILALERLLQAGTMHLRLFTNNATLAHGQTEADYTEASGGGYAAIAIGISSWVFTPGSPSTAAYPQVTFTFTGSAGTCYGYYLTDDTASGKAVWAEKFADPIVTANGSTIKITLNLSGASVTND